MSEEEDKPKPEGEQQRARDVAELREELKQKRKELAGKSFDELLAEIEVEGAKVERLYELEKDWDEVKEEITERVSHLNQLQLEFVKRPKKAGDYSKWARAREMAKMISLVIEDRNVKEFKEVLENTTKGLNDIESLKRYAKDRGLSMGEYLQLRTLGRLEEISFQSYNSEARDTTRFAMDNIPDVHFQAAATDTMLAVRKYLKKIAENTDKKGQFILIVAASALVAISVGFLVDVILLGWKDEIEKDPWVYISWALGLLSVIGLVFAGLKIRKRVKKKTKAPVARV